MFSNDESDALYFPTFCSAASRWLYDIHFGEDSMRHDKAVQLHCHLLYVLCRESKTETEN